MKHRISIAPTNEDSGDRNLRSGSRNEILSFSSDNASGINESPLFYPTGGLDTFTQSTFSTISSSRNYRYKQIIRDDKVQRAEPLMQESNGMGDRD